MRRATQVLGYVNSDGTISLVDPKGIGAAVTAGTQDAWRAAVGTMVRIRGEHGLVEGRILSVADGAMGGVRPRGLRPEALIVYFETAVAHAPDGDMTYGIETVVTGVNELFLTRGDDVFDNAVLMAVLN